MTKLSRRTVLRGLGATVALPFLDAMYPVFAAQAVKTALRPTRMAFLYVPNGIVMEDWTPAGGLGATPLVELPRISSALAPYRHDVMMLTGLTSNGGRALGDGAGDHGRAGAAYLTGVHPKKTSGKDIQAGISMDQIAAQHLEGKTKFASLELGCEEGIQGGNCDNGYSCAYSNSLAWRSPTSPMPPEVRPRAVFERLFGVVDDEPDPKRRQRLQSYQRSVLDVVLGDAQSLKSTLGGTDRQKVDEYLFAIRDIEKRIQQAERNHVPQMKAPMEAPSSSVPTDFTEHSRLMLDLLTLAFQTDQTRIVTVLMGIEQSPRNYPEIGITEGHHGLTHHQGDKAKIEKVRLINEYHIKQFTYLLDKLTAIKDGDGTLLDNSMIVYGSALADGNAHQHDNLPTVLAGRAGGRLKPGRHIRYANETPIANLYLSMLDRMGVPVDRLGDSSGRLEGLSDV
ncbi:MAG: DUF1552 domain-containing protein [Vicinamibacterales bacterium]